MECPHCTADLPDDNIYCEECGKPLEALPPVPRCVCGTPVSEADEEGFCGTCGRRVRPRETDHMEVELSPDFAAVSDKGKRHDRNEDRFAIRQTSHSIILAVCDGVSSSRESELASGLAVETIATLLEGGASLVDAMTEAASSVAMLVPAGSHDSPSTTAVAAVVRGNEVTVGWAGDSRAYWINDSESNPGDSVFQLTTDHSWLNGVVAAGEMTLEEASRDQRAHSIARWFGADAVEESTAEIATFPIPGPGYLLLCSDGLWNYAQRLEEIEALMPRSGTALEICRQLVDFANGQGGQDNITVALLHLSGEA